MPYKPHVPKLGRLPMAPVMDHREHPAMAAANVYRDLLYLHRPIAFWLARPQKRKPRQSENINENAIKRKLGTV